MGHINKIGIFGGTFNPVHNAHLTIAERFVDQCNLDFCLFVPAFISPFKTDDDSINLATPEQRIEMLQLAIADNPKFDIDDFEIQQNGISYSEYTIDYLIKKYSNPELFLLIGTDQAQDFQLWKNWQQILEKTQLCIAHRPNYKSNKELKDKLTINNKKPFWIEAPLMEISASDIRMRISEGKEVEKLISNGVINYIKDNGLYKVT